jgi:hypothetical protein
VKQLTGELFTAYVLLEHKLRPAMVLVRSTESYPRVT